MSGGRKLNLREIGEDIRSAKATLLLLLFLTLVQSGLEAAGGFRAHPEVFGALGLSRRGLAAGDFWQPVSYALIHGNWIHLLINGFALLAIGPRVERIGGGRLLLLLLASGILAGGGVHLLLAGNGGFVPLVGISGGIAAALLWLTGVSPGSRMWPLRISGRSLGLGILLASGILAVINPDLGIPVLSDWGRAMGRHVGEGVSHACHFGGAVVGWATARWTLRPRISLARLQKERARREASDGL